MIWIESLTGKQSLLFSFVINNIIKKKNIDYFVSTRDYDYIRGIFNIYNIKNVFYIGKYSGKTPKEKLISGINRQIGLLDIINRLEKEIKLHISFTSPDASRISFGLGIPILSLTDSPHSYFVNKLVLPLSTHVVIPYFILRSIRKFVVDAQIHTFNGVFELIWTKDFIPNEKYLLKFSLEPFQYCIVRLEESKAAYYPKINKPTVLGNLIRKLASVSKVLVYPRYREQVEFLHRNIDSPNVIMSPDPTITQHLEYYASVVITGGSSMAQESCLLGTPSIVLFPYRIDVTDWLISKGLPIFHITVLDKALNLAMSIIKNPDRYRINVRDIIKEMEDPLVLIEEIISEYVTESQ